MRQWLKLFHTIATAGLVGGLLVQLLVAQVYTPLLATNDPAVLGARQLMHEVARWVIAPSLAVVVLSGFASMLVKRSFAQAGWVWFKVLLGFTLVKGLLLLNLPAARDLAALARQGFDAGSPEMVAELARLARIEWWGSWVALAVVVIAIAVSIWRPRRMALTRRPASSAAGAAGVAPATSASVATDDAVR